MTNNLLVSLELHVFWTYFDAYNSTSRNTAGRSQAQI